MSSADSLLERTRLAALDRVREVRRALALVQSPESPELGLALRTLHAIKGESSMAGLRALSGVAHALETLLLRRRVTPPFYCDDARDALGVLEEILAAAPAGALDAHPDLADLRAEIEAAFGDAVSPAAAPPAAPARAEKPAAEAPSAAATEEPRRAVEPQQDSWFRIEARDVDDLCGRVSEVAADVDRARLQLSALFPLASGRAAARALQALAEELALVRSRIAGVEDRTWGLRLVAVQPLLWELAGHIERLAVKLRKQVRVEVNAGGVALERSLVEALREPLLHLANNAIDHGIEPNQHRGGKPATACIRLLAESHGNEVVVTVEDDGAGLDFEALRSRAVATRLVEPTRAQVMTREELLDLAFVDGFSQREEVDEVSGRGLGLGAARAKVERLGGAMRLSTTAGQGTRFELVLAATAGRERVLVVEAAGLLWAIPSRWVRAVVRDPELVATARSERMLRTQEGILPVRSLGAWLGAGREEETAVLAVEIAGRRRGLTVGRSLYEVNLFRTPTDPLVAAATRVVASGMLEDGRPVFFVRWGEVLREEGRRQAEAVPAAGAAPPRPRVLVVDDSAVIRDIVSEILTAAGAEVITADDGKCALEVLGQQRCDLVITDIEMPRMTGLELLERIRQDSELIPVVVLTTRNRPEHRREAALLGANAYITKSEFHGDTLLEVVRRFVDFPT